MSTTVWKKAIRRVNDKFEYVIVEMTCETYIMPPKNINPHRKCRAEKVNVVKIHDYTHTDDESDWAANCYNRASPSASCRMYTSDGDVFSHYKHSTKYVEGQVVKADWFDNDPMEVCTGGIHFFLTREEAEGYFL